MSLSWVCLGWVVSLGLIVLGAVIAGEKQKWVFKVGL